MKEIVPAGYVESRIYFIRNLRVMLSSDLAVLYGVSTKYLNQQVSRNRSRFPTDFMVRLTWEEVNSLRLQIVTLKKGRGGHSKYPPIAFTEQGIAMLSGVLNSPKSIAVNIEIMRAFVRLRALLAGHKDMARKPVELERKYENHDVQIRDIFNAIRRVMNEPEKKKGKRIGFV